MDDCGVALLQETSIWFVWKWGTSKTSWYIILIMDHHSPYGSPFNPHRNPMEIPWNHIVYPIFFRNRKSSATSTNQHFGSPSYHRYVQSIWLSVCSPWYIHLLYLLYCFLLLSFSLSEWWWSFLSLLLSSWFFWLFHVYNIHIYYTSLKKNNHVWIKNWIKKSPFQDGNKPYQPLCLMMTCKPSGKIQLFMAPNAAEAWKKPYMAWCKISQLPGHAEDLEDLERVNPFISAHRLSSSRSSPLLSHDYPSNIIIIINIPLWFFHYDYPSNPVIS